MTIRIAPDGCFDPAQVHAEIDRLEGLVADLRRLLDVGASQPGDHPDAPVIHCWDYALRQSLCLTGRVSGHPDPSVGRPGRITITSDLWILDRERGLARTLSRWYRLGDENPEYAIAGREIH
jgi:hypothetical protein